MHATRVLAACIALCAISLTSVSANGGLQEAFDVQIDGECRADILYHCSAVLTAAQRTATYRAQSEELVQVLDKAVRTAEAKVKRSPPPAMPEPAPSPSPSPSPSPKQETNESKATAAPDSKDRKQAAAADGDVQTTTSGHDKLTELQQSLNLVSDSKQQQAQQGVDAVAAAAEDEEDAKDLEKEERQAALQQARAAQMKGTDPSSTAQDRAPQSQAPTDNDGKVTRAGSKAKAGAARSTTAGASQATSADSDTVSKPTEDAVEAQREEEEDAKDFEVAEQEAALDAVRADQEDAGTDTAETATKDSDIDSQTVSATGDGTADTQAGTSDGDAMAGQPAFPARRQRGRQAAPSSGRKKAAASKSNRLKVRKAQGHGAALGMGAGGMQAGDDREEAVEQGAGKNDSGDDGAAAASFSQAAASTLKARSTGIGSRSGGAGAGFSKADNAEADVDDDKVDVGGGTDDYAQFEKLRVAGGRKAGSERRLMGITAGESDAQKATVSSQAIQQRDFHRHEVDELAKQQSDVSEVLEMVDLDPGLPVAALLTATAPVSRCLRQVIRDQELSIAPEASQISLPCQEVVRSFLINRAADIASDPPLIATCAGSIVKHCKNVTDAPGQMFHCLKLHKPELTPLCRAAVIARQVDASEDMALDAVLSEACSADRQRLCPDAGWGEGAAQGCLERVLHADVLADMQDANDPAGSASGKPYKAVGKDKLGLSPKCATALFRKQVEESEDIRFNFRLAHACSGDKHMFCRDVRPGVGDVVGCLEDHAFQPSFTETCRNALIYYAQLRAIDVRLDAHFRRVCQSDVRALCLDVESQILESIDEPPGAGSRVMECMRRVREDIRNPSCAAHVKSIMRTAYTDNRLDTLLMDRCEEDATKLCIDKRSTVECLRGKLALHEPLQPECAEMVRERVRQASADLSFMPELEEACSTEVATFCAAAHLQGPLVLDCLADNRRDESFGSGCREMLVRHLSDAVSDVRMLHTLQEDCEKDIQLLCNSTKPGEGRVLACLQQQRANITEAACKKQMLRMLGLAVDDYRLDYSLSQACKADVQQLCAGVKPTDTGAVHACLRKSLDHLSPECRAAQDQLETMEHEDVRLNPRIQRECPLAISMFCSGDIAPGGANVIMCLQQSASKPNFPEECRRVMMSLMQRSSLKYSLNVKLKSACDADVATLCPGHNDEPSNSTDLGILGCLAASSAQLSKGCRSEMAALVKLHLNNYHVGLPLTTVCDGDVMARCNVDKQVTPFLMSGYILSCLSKSASQLHTPCWSLISMFDEGQYQSAASVDSKPWTTEMGKETLKKIKEEVATEVANQVAAEVRGDLESKMLNNIQHKVETAVEKQHGKIKPLVIALVNATSILIAIVAVLALVAWFVWTKYVRRATDGRTRTLAIKDGRV